MAEEREIDIQPTWGTYLLFRAAWIVHHRWRAAKFYLYVTMRKSDFSWLTIQVPAYHGASLWRDVYSDLGDENSDAGHISNVHAGRGFPTPDLNRRHK